MYVRWAGACWRAREYWTWEPQSELLKDVPELVGDYCRRHHLKAPPAAELALAEADAAAADEAEAAAAAVPERGGGPASQTPVPDFDVAALLATVAATGHARVLHLAGTHRTPAAVPATLQVVVRAVYEAQLAPLNAAAKAALRAAAVDWALLFSTRSAAHFADLFDTLGADRATLSIATISARALAAAGGGWRRAVAAATPDEAGILAASGLSCDKAPA